MNIRSAPRVAGSANRSKRKGFPGGPMTLVAVNFFVAFVLLLADEVFSGVEDGQ